MNSTVYDNLTPARVMPGKPSSSKGFALLMVLLVLVIAGTVLAVAARRSCRLAMEATAAQQRLQVDWGAQSIRTSLLPAAETVLAAEASAHGTSPASVRRTLVLGGVRFDLLFGDEQAKANVNILEQQHGRKGLDMRLQALQQDARQRIRVDLRPGPDERRLPGAAPATYRSLDQVFVFDHPSELVDLEAGRVAFGPITIWSSGGVNFKRASRVVLREVLAGVLADNQIDDIARLAETSPKATLTEALRQANASGRQMRAARALLADSSSCHSLWVVAHGSARNWYRLYVDRPAERGTAPDGLAFEW